MIFWYNIGSSFLTNLGRMKNDFYLRQANFKTVIYHLLKLKVSIMPSRLGSPNKNKKFLLNRLQDMYGDDFHPIMKMAESAVRLHELAAQTQSVSDLKCSIDAWDKIAQYTEPRLKSVDLGIDGRNTSAPTEIILKAV